MVFVILPFRAGYVRWKLFRLLMSIKMTWGDCADKLRKLDQPVKMSFSMPALRLDSLDLFATIVRCGGFRAAASEVGISSSALSQSVSALERSLGIRLLNRTTRSIAPTEAGARLLERLAPALGDIKTAIADLDQLRDSPSGTIRINAPGPAVELVLCPVVFDFMQAYPEVNVELVSDAAMIDMVKQGFDAGVRFGKQIEQDMIAVPLGPPLRYAIAASPRYLEKAGTPLTPHDLAGHQCIRRRFPGGTLVEWEFAKDGEVLKIVPEGRVTLSSAHQEVRAALAGQGIAHVFHEYAEPYVRTGQLIEILKHWSATLPSWYLYYPNRRHPGAAMKALLRHLGSYNWKTAAARSLDDPVSAT